MIVCNLCGASIHLQGAKCDRCGGKGVVTSSPLRLHTPGSPGSDKWANRYTMTPPASPLGQSKDQRSPMSTSKRVQSQTRTQVVVDVLVPDSGQVSLTRVHGCVLDPNLSLPECECCSTPIQPGHKLYSAPRPGPGGLLPGSTMCRDCFASTFKLGICNLCHMDVLGERDEGYGGLHVKGKGVMWHARCFVCSTCAVNLAKTDHCVDPDGTPFCLPCAIKNEDEQEEPPKKPHRYILPGTIRADIPQTSSSSVGLIHRHSPPDPYPLRTAMAVKAKAGVVTQMKELFEAGSR